MADESATHEVDLEYRFWLQLLSIDQTPIKKRPTSSFDTLCGYKITIDHLTMIRGLRDLSFDHATLFKSPRKLSTPLVVQPFNRQNGQQEESKTLCASQRSFDSFYNKNPSLPHGSVDGITEIMCTHLFETEKYMPGLRCQRSKNSQSQFSHKTWLLWNKNKKEKEKQTVLDSLNHNICAALKLLRNHLKLVSTTMDLLDDATMSLNTIQDESLEWLEKIEQISDRLLERLRRVYTQLVIYAVIFFWLFDEYPNGIRHLCTTMPWTIWPALVVLWGVCWMFYSGPVLCAVAEDERTLPLGDQEQLLDFQDGFLGVDNGIDLSDTSLLDTTAFPWDFWSDTPPATHDWGVIDQQVQIDETAAPSSILAISPTTTLLFATAPNRNELVNANQSIVHDPSRTDPFFSPEAVQNSQTRANLTKQTTDTPIQPRRIYTRTQRGSFNCPNCDRSFTRSDSLRRHVSAKHARDREFLCSNSSCERSKKGQGFNRRDKWKAHENSTCKSRSRSSSSSSSGAGIPSEAAPQLDSIANASLVCQESSGATWIHGTVRPGTGTLQNQDVISELRKLCQAKKEALLIKEKECEAERKAIAHLNAVIELLEGSNTTTGI